MSILWCNRSICQFLLIVFCLVFTTPASFAKTPKCDSIETCAVLAEKGNVKAQKALGLIYIKGRGVERDYQRAHYWLLKAAKQNDANSQFILSLMYANAMGVEQNYGKGFYWMQKAADQGDAKAETLLARMYIDGRGITDLMDVLAGYQMRANAPLDEIATLLGFPGKMGMSGADVWENFQAGDIEGIRNYCETDVLNTYLVYLRFELIRGQITQAQYQQDIHTLHAYLEKEHKPHLQAFSEALSAGG